MAGTPKPVHEIRLGRIRASIWVNHSESGTLWFNVTVTRLYKAGAAGAAGEKWKDASGFGRDDLPLVAKVADMAHAWIWEHEAAVHETRAPS